MLGGRKYLGQYFFLEVMQKQEPVNQLYVLPVLRLCSSFCFIEHDDFPKSNYLIGGPLSPVIHSRSAAKMHAQRLDSLGAYPRWVRLTTGCITGPRQGGSASASSATRSAASARLSNRMMGSCSSVSNTTKPLRSDRISSMQRTAAWKGAPVVGSTCRCSVGCRRTPVGSVQTCGAALNCLFGRGASVGECRDGGRRGSYSLRVAVLRLLCLAHRFFISPSVGKLGCFQTIPLAIAKPKRLDLARFDALGLSAD